MDGLTLENYNSLLRLSCAKIVSGRHRRGGTNLHKNLLVLTVIGKVQVEKQKLESMKTQPTIVMMETDLTLDDQEAADEDEDISPPLEFSVTDAPIEESGPVSGEVAFASEAIEESAESLRDRKRKSDVRQIIPRSKSQRVIGERCVPSVKSY